MFNEMFWISSSFVVFILVSWRPVVAAVSNALLQHASNITHDLQESERIHKEASERLAVLNKEMEAALVQASSIVENAKEDASNIIATAVKEAERISTKRSEIALQRIAQYEESLMNQIRNDLIAMAGADVEQKLGEGLEKSLQLKLMEEDLDNIKKIIN